jgi:hypothetical protein
MNKITKTKSIFIAIIFFGIFGLTNISQAATTYYISPGTSSACSAGSDSINSGTSITTPWLTFAKAMTVLHPGDTLYLCDGIYTSTNKYNSSYLLAVAVSGTPSSYITIQALNDGKAIVDGQNSIMPFHINNQSYINVKGIVFKNGNSSGNGQVGVVSGDLKNGPGSHDIKIQRCGFYNGGLGSGNDTLLILQYDTWNVLVEDCSASQLVTPYGGRYCYQVFNGAHDNTLRRNFCKFNDHVYSGGPCACIVFYGGHDNIAENNVCNLVNAGTCSGNAQRGGIFGEGNYNNISGNKLYGNVIFSNNVNGWLSIQVESIKDGCREGSPPIPVNCPANDWEMYNNVMINVSKGVWQGMGDDWIFHNNTMTGITDNTYGCYWKRGIESGGTCFGTCNGDIKNSSFVNSSIGINDWLDTALTHTYNNLYSVTTCFQSTSPGTSDKCSQLSPNYDTSTYGKGAYLMIPSALQRQGENGADIGARVLYRYQDSFLISTPLWPWPMEDRIKSETGYSVTYESGGGLWKTLNGVYSQIDIAAPTGVTVK